MINSNLGPILHRFGDTGVITSAVWPHKPKMVKIGRAGPPRHRGEISC